MKIGKICIRSSWIWLLVFTIIGSIVEIYLGATDSWGKEIAWRSSVKASHSHALCLAFLNMFYGLFIDKVNLKENLKKIGCYLSTVGMILMPSAILLSLLSEPLAMIAPLGGISIIVSLIIMVYGQFQTNQE